MCFAPRLSGGAGTSSVDLEVSLTALCGGCTAMLRRIGRTDNRLALGVGCRNDGGRTMDVSSASTGRDSCIIAVSTTGCSNDPVRVSDRIGFKTSILASIAAGTAVRMSGVDKA